MKQPVLLFFILGLLTSSLFAQERANGTLNIDGKWDVTCAIQYLDKSSIRYCDLCPYKLSDNNQSFVILPFEMIFAEDSLKLNATGEWQIIPYAVNAKNRAVSFSFDKKDYTFRVHYGTNCNILEDTKGRLLILERPKEKKK
jgi:hypothetical protein